MNRTALNRLIAVLLVGANGCAESPNSTEVKKPAFDRAGTERKAEQKKVVGLTPAAVAKLRDALRRDGKPYVRVGVVSGGTTGFMYDLKLDNVLDGDNDYLDGSDGVEVIVDKRSALFLYGATVDWKTAADGRQGFSFDNPNAVKK
jgi:iron-sulfur cluster assembly protein